MSSAHSMNVKKCVHAQKPYSCQAFPHESSKVGRRVKEEGKKEKKETGFPGGCHQVAGMFGGLCPDVSKDHQGPRGPYIQKGVWIT